MNDLPLIVQQANAFYNYTLGFYASEIDLVKTATHAIKLGVSSSAYFSDNKFIYPDEEGKVQLEWIQQKGRFWDSPHKFSLKKELPGHIMKNLVFALEGSFHEGRIGQLEITPYVRLDLPPIVLGGSEEINIPLHVSVKIYEDGIAILSFLLDDRSWENADESFFINEVVNLFSRYFEDVWIDAKIQKLEADLILPHAYQGQITLAGKPLKGRDINKSIRKMREEARKTFNDSMSKEGTTFYIDGKKVVLHKAAGSEQEDMWESSFDFCTSVYIDALSNLIVPEDGQKEYASMSPLHWQGRPSISLMRFNEQPDNKEKLLKHYKQSLLRILSRSEHVEGNSELPDDLRPMGDFTFHGTRAIFLWTWIKSKNAPSDVWKDPNTFSFIMNQQCRAEHIEYYNMRLTRACKLTRFPPSENHLINSYRILCMAEDDLHHSSGAGEITDALKTVLSDFGTMDLVPSAKEAARWYLDEMRYKTEKSRLKVDRWLTLVFGLVGTTGLSEFLIKPFVEIFLTDSEILAPVYSFVISAIIVFLIILLVWFFSRR
jgi:hypothetical protein